MYMDKRRTKRKVQKQADKIKEVLGSYFEKEEHGDGHRHICAYEYVMVGILKDTGTPPHHAIFTVWDFGC
jgi:hypothetical protein